MTSQLSQQQLETLLLVKCLGDGKGNPFLPKPKRKRISFTPLEILYQIFLYQKNVDRGKWTDIHTMKETIASHAGMCRTSITNFFNSKTLGTSFFVGVARNSKRQNGKFQSNRYWLKPGIKEVLIFLERKGFFKGIKKDRLKWRKWFDNRLEKWLIPLLEKGLTLRQIFKGEMNILSTKKHAKLAVVEPAKLAYTTQELTTQRHLENPVVSSLYAKFEDVQTKLEKRLQIPKWQIKIFTMRNSLGVLSLAVDNTIRMTNGDWQPKRMEALLQSNIKQYHARLR